MMIDGLELQGRTNVVALGITTEGVKIPLGLWEGSTENATVATALLSDLVERGLDPEQGILFVIDGAKALRKAIRNVFGEAPVQRCLRHKERNVIEHLPERDRPPVKQRLRRAWALDDHARALDQLRLLASELERSLPRRRRLAARRDRGDADAQPARRHRLRSSARSRVDQPLRVDDRDRPPHPAQRQALVLRRDGAALDRRRHARSRTAVSEASSATATSPPSSSRSNATTTVAVTPIPLTPRPRRPLSSSPPDHHTGTAATKFHGDRDILRGIAWAFLVEPSRILYWRLARACPVTPYNWRRQRLGTPTEGEDRVTYPLIFPLTGHEREFCRFACWRLGGACCGLLGRCRLSGLSSNGGIEMTTAGRRMNLTVAAVAVAIALLVTPAAALAAASPGAVRTRSEAACLLRRPSTNRFRSRRDRVRPGEWIGAVSGAAGPA